MQDDEREHRHDPVSPEPDEPAADLPTREEDETLEQADAADEFETATWPQQDSTGAAEPEPEPGPRDAAPDASDEAPAGWRESEGEPLPASAPGDAPPRSDAAATPPPPSDVEAYPPSEESTAEPVEAHSVPATEPGESTLCARCGTENRPGIAFCRNCGQRLVAAGAPTTVERPSAPEGTQACPRCGTHNRAGVAFCQNCGANLRAAAEGYVPPAVEAEGAVAAEGRERADRALLGPTVLLIGAIGIAVAWLLPFLIGDASLYDQSFGRSDGYGLAFWNAYEQAPTLMEQAYFGFAAPAPILVGLLVLLAISGVVRAAPGLLQMIGLAIALAWAIGLVVLFVVVEVVGGPGGGILDILRALSPGGIIFMLASLIVVIGALTRIGRS